MVQFFKSKKKKNIVLILLLLACFIQSLIIQDYIQVKMINFIK